MKNIVLIDADFDLIESLLKTGQYKIALVISNFISKEEKLKLQHQIPLIQPRNQITYRDFAAIYHNDYNLTYDEIRSFQATQLRVEHYIQRYCLDRGMILYMYYLALGFYLDFFSKNHIDMIFLNDQVHYAYSDGIIKDIAAKKGIDFFNLGLSSGTDKETILHLYHNENFVNIEEVVSGGGVDLKPYIKSLQNPQKPALKKPLKYFFATKIKSLPSFISHFVVSTKYNLNHKIKKPIVRCSRVDVFYGSLYVKKLLKFYEQLSVEINLTQDRQNFIYYSLNLEPEAIIMPRAVLNSQIFIIKMLAYALPKGYKLYVKEHPAQFFIYERHNILFSNISYFRTPLFYQQLKQIPNVEIISIKTPSSELIKHAKGVAFLAGSVGIEAVLLKKPLLNFGINLSFVNLLKDCFHIRSKQDLKDALIKIEQGFIPHYEDLESVVEKFCLSSRALKSDKDILIKLFDKMLEIQQNQDADSIVR
ncbi:hypothetical protein [Helicobacter sp. UBA3407]|uniref:capsular polysaccharide export protein, LipB/KpsS family n=1 Tax=Helicobacter sp. UBA3407 TaxID=1946588 RepID=UPI0026250C4F|nr:hypothetical protein [Helicobacter sp. UBA3407]